MNSSFGEKLMMQRARLTISRHSNLPGTELSLKVISEVMLLRWCQVRCPVTHSVCKEAYELQPAGTQFCSAVLSTEDLLLQSVLAADQIDTA